MVEDLQPTEPVYTDEPAIQVYSLKYDWFELRKDFPVEYQVFEVRFMGYLQKLELNLPVTEDIRAEREIIQQLTDSLSATADTPPDELADTQPMRPVIEELPPLSAVDIEGASSEWNFQVPKKIATTITNVFLGQKKPSLPVFDSLANETYYHPAHYDPLVTPYDRTSDNRKFDLDATQPMRSVDANGLE